MECNNNECSMYEYCLTQKHDYETCADMVSRYNAGLLLAPEYVKNSAFQELMYECFN